MENRGSTIPQAACPSCWFSPIVPGPIRPQAESGRKPKPHPIFGSPLHGQPQELSGKTHGVRGGVTPATRSRRRPGFRDECAERVLARNFSWPRSLAQPRERTSLHGRQPVRRPTNRRPLEVRTKPLTPREETNTGPERSRATIIPRPPPDFVVVAQGGGAPRSLGNALPRVRVWPMGRLSLLPTWGPLGGTSVPLPRWPSKPVARPATRSWQPTYAGWEVGRTPRARAVG